MGYLIELLLPGLALALVLGVVAGWQLHEARTRSEMDDLSTARDQALADLLAFSDPKRARERVEAAEARAAAAEAESQALGAKLNELEEVRARLAAAEALLAAAEADLDGARAAYDAELARERAERAQDATRWSQALAAETGARAEVERARDAAMAEGAQAQTSLAALQARLDEAEAARDPESVRWRARYLEARVRYLEGRAPAMQALAAKVAELEPRAALVEPLQAQVSDLEARLARAPTAEDEDERVRTIWRNRYLAARVRRLESEIFERLAAAPAAAEESAESARRRRWRLAYFEARAAHLAEGAAAREQALAAAQADLARRRAADDAADRLAARLLAALQEAARRDGAPVPLVLPDFARGPRAWTSDAAAERAGDPAGWTFPTLEEDGVAAQAAGQFRELRPKAFVPLEPGRRYRVAARVRQLVDATNGGGQVAGIDAFPGLTADLRALEARDGPNCADGPDGPRSRALTAADGWVTLSAVIERGGSQAAFVRPRVYVNWRGDRSTPGDGVAQVAWFEIVDITETAARPAATPSTDQTQAAERRAAWRRRYLAARVERLEALAAEAQAAQAQAQARALEIEAAGERERAELRVALERAQAAALQAQTQSARIAVVEPTAPPPPLPAARPRTLPAPFGGIPDDLRMIAGIDPQLERSLNAIGIYHFSQIAAWTPGNVAWVDRYMSLRGRIMAEQWVEKARALVNGGPGLDQAAG